MKRRFGCVVALFVFCLGLSQAQAYTIKRGGGNDDGLPSPFEVNRKVELADGERYLLVGTVRLSDGVPFLEIDLDLQPWLSSRQRKEMPYYLILNAESRTEAGKIVWKDFLNQKVRVVVEARTMVSSDFSGTPRALNAIIPIKRPTPFEATR